VLGGPLCDRCPGGATPAKGWARARCDHGGAVRRWECHSKRTDAVLYGWLNADRGDAMPAPKPTKERQRQLATGLARIAAGDPIDRAARSCGVPSTTLRRWHERAYAADPDAVKRLEQIVLAQACEIATNAGAELADRVPRLDDGELIASWWTAVDKIALRQGWARGSDGAVPTNAAEALARMANSLAGKTMELTLSVSANEGRDGDASGVIESRRP